MFDGHERVRKGKVFLEKQLDKKDRPVTWLRMYFLGKKRTPNYFTSGVWALE